MRGENSFTGYIIGNRMLTYDANLVDNIIKFKIHIFVAKDKQI